LPVIPTTTLSAVSAIVVYSFRKGLALGGQVFCGAETL